MKKKKEMEKPKCAGCLSTQVYTRQTTGERVCRVCGSVTDKNGKLKEAA